MAKSKAATGEKVEQYEAVVATLPGVERKGAANPYTSVNGNMFSILAGGEKLGLRLPEGVREAFLKRYDTTLVEAYGVVMKEYVLVPDELLGKTAELAKHFAASHDYAKGLKSKSTTRPKAAKKTAKKKARKAKW